MTTTSTAPPLSGRVRIGYKASAEQFDAPALLEFARQAEAAGLDLVATSDHFQPWRHRGGHSPAALPWLGGAAVTTSTAVLGTSVMTPTLRYEPAIVAQAFATLGRLAPDRVFLGVGTGEAMNETPATGAEFPGRRERRLRLAEAIELIRRLWREERVDFAGEFYRTSRATGSCTSGKRPELYTDLLDKVLEGAQEAGRDGSGSGG